MRIRIVLASFLTLLGLGIAIVIQNTFDYREYRIGFVGGGNRLRGTLTIPGHGDGPYGLVVFVHGDGPSDASDHNGYRPIWEAFAESGYASLSWDKPGVGGSSGNWLRQSMDDRAREVLDAVVWAKGRNDIDRTRIGLFGGSQAGWVMPKVVNRDSDISFMIAVSTAINWRRQGRYNLLAELRDRNASKEKIDEAVRLSDKRWALIGQKASYAEYRAGLGDHADMSPDRWEFAKINQACDASEDLRTMRGSRTRVLLVLGGHDDHVDVTETERAYREALPETGLHVVHYPDATHSMIRHDLERSGARLVLSWIFSPRSIYAAGFLEDLRHYLPRFP